LLRDAAQFFLVVGEENPNMRNRPVSTAWKQVAAGV
jgi:hypothetical protein